MKKFTMAALASFAAASAMPANAQVYDAFASFTGNAPQSVESAGGFLYGQRSLVTPGLGGARFTSNTNCAFVSSICLQQNSIGSTESLPGVYKGGIPSVQYSTIMDQADQLLVHPGPDSSLGTYLGYVVAKTGWYDVFGSFTVADTNPTGVDIYFNYAPGNLADEGIQDVLIGSIGSRLPTFTDTRRLFLQAGDGVSYALGNGGSYFNDSTAVTFRLTAVVPEPATWAMMIAGFGLIGGAMRRRAMVRSVTFA